MMGFSILGAMGLGTPSLTALPGDGADAMRPGAKPDGSDDAPDSDFESVLLSLLGGVFETPEAEEPSMERNGTSRSGTATEGALETAEEPSETESHASYRVAPRAVEGTAHATPSTAQAPLADRETKVTLDGTGVAPVRKADDGSESNSTSPTDVAPAPSTEAGRPDSLEATLALLDDRGIAPELVAPLRRVITRMWQEYGHQVEVVEGYRTPQRQAQLFQQGRTTRGPVVTWTRDSLHSTGRAADLRIDGGWTDVKAFETLQMIAREEGLATLGMRDPGHVELPDSGSRNRAGARDAEAFRPAAPKVAAPARLASVARVAGVASVPRPDVGAQHPEADAPTTSGQSVSTRAERVTATIDDTTPKPERHEGSSPTGDHRAPPVTTATGGTREPGAMGSAMADGAIQQDPSVPRPSTPTGGQASTTEAVQRAQDLQAASQTHRADRVFLDIENADGVGTRLRLTLRGSALDASIHIDDPETARVMHSRISELHKALEQRGFDSKAVRIQSEFRTAGERVEIAPALRPEVSEAVRGTLSSLARSRDGGDDDAWKQLMNRDRPDPDEGSQHQSGRHRQPGKEQQ